MAFAEGRDPEHVAEGIEGHYCKLGVAGSRNVVTRAVIGVKSLVRHARPCAGHPRLSSSKVK
jgi:hypothetical protein